MLRVDRYTNLGYLAAGQVITRAAGQPFSTYVSDAVLEPAGMTRTGFTYQPDADAATGYVHAAGLGGQAGIRPRSDDGLRCGAGPAGHPRRRGGSATAS